MKTPSVSTESLPDEQLEKKMVAVEDVDVRGTTTRQRVIDQTVFDALFIRGLIDQCHHEASHKFIESYGKSGAYTKGANMDGGPHQTGKDAGNAIAERRMAFSSAYRFAVDKCGEDKASTMIAWMGSVHQIPEEDEEIVKLAKSLLPGLDALSDFYSTRGLPDPRRILRRQGGSLTGSGKVNYYGKSRKDMHRWI